MLSENNFCSLPKEDNFSNSWLRVLNSDILSKVSFSTFFKFSESLHEGSFDFNMSSSAFFNCFCILSKSFISDLTKSVISSSLEVNDLKRSFNEGSLSFNVFDITFFGPFNTSLSYNSK